VALSETVRRYLGARFGLPAMDRTTTELLPLVRGLDPGRGVWEDVRDVLRISDDAKFAARTGTSEDAGDAMARSVRIVDRTRAGAPEGAAVEGEAAC